MAPDVVRGEIPRQVGFLHRVNQQGATLPAPNDGRLPMKIEVQDDGIVLSEVFGGVAIKTERGMFGIAERDGGLEVMLNGKHVWSSEEPEPTECPRCAGCGKVADSESGEPWSYWEAIPPPSNMAVVMGIVKPIACPKCSGSGLVAEHA